MEGLVRNEENTGEKKKLRTQKSRLWQFCSVQLQSSLHDGVFAIKFYSWRGLPLGFSSMERFCGAGTNPSIRLLSITDNPKAIDMAAVGEKVGRNSEIKIQSMQVMNNERRE